MLTWLSLVQDPSVPTVPVADFVERAIQVERQIVAVIDRLPNGALFVLHPPSRPGWCEAMQPWAPPQDEQTAEDVDDDESLWEDQQDDPHYCAAVWRSGEIGTGEGRAALCHALLCRNAADWGARTDSEGWKEGAGQVNAHMLVETSKANTQLSGMSCMLTARFRGTLCLTAAASLLSSPWRVHVEVIH